MTAVGVVTDLRYTYHLTGSGHPECPARLDAIASGLNGAGLFGEDIRISPAVATLEQVALCHNPDYIKLVQEEAEQLTEGELAYLSTGDAIVCPISYDIALLAAGGVIAGVDAVMGGNFRSVFCAVRPPGHHATRSRGMGFCLFNSVAIGARWAQKQWGVDRVAIVDWDVHHGNGTQDIFDADPSVLYISTHESPLYPFTGAASECGVGDGEGTTINCPIRGGAGARERVLAAFKDRVLPALETFAPNLVMISAGFDAHELDPLGDLRLKDRDYVTLTQNLVNIAHKYCAGRVVSVLEGGYSLEALKSAVPYHVQALQHRAV